MGPIAERAWDLRAVVAAWVAGAFLGFAGFLWQLGLSLIEIATAIGAFGAIALLIFAGASVSHRRAPRWIALAAVAGLAVALASVYVASRFGAWWGIAAAAVVGVVGLLQGAPYEEEPGVEDPEELDEAVLEERDVERRADARNAADSIRPF
jgi:hypothetical protein